MYDLNLRIRVVLFLTVFSAVSASYRVDLTQNGPIVKGAEITFKAILYYRNQLASGSFKYSWTDVAVPTNNADHKIDGPYDEWTVSYNKSIYPEGRYVAQVKVSEFYVFLWTEVASNRIEFYINETLNGDIALVQNNQTRNGIFVSNTETVVHNITLKKTDANFIKNASSVLTFWFIDCTYYGLRRDLIFPFNYSQADQEHYVEALVVADFTPPPPITTTTTTTTTTSTTTSTTTTTTSTTVKPTTIQPNVTTSKPPPSQDITHKPFKREINEKLPYNHFFPYICNNSRVTTDPAKTYGYFSKNIKVKAPVSKVNVTGNNWLRHGEVLTLNVKCHGSKDMKYCVQYAKGNYNVTGNETCTVVHNIEKCDFTIERYFVESMQHTIVIIIENDVNKVVTPVAVTVYEEKKQAQLSVIVVPVAFSLVAVVLIVFGVAYYMQNRLRFVVEVADFNFGQNYSDMEYKTFKERLRDSIANAFFTRAPSHGSSEVPVWPPGRKYGSMRS